MGGGQEEDDTSDGDALDNRELRVVLAGVCAFLGWKIDLLGMDACLMNMVEVAYQLRNSVNILVGSEIEEPFDGWSYAEILSRLTARPRQDAAALARWIVKSYLFSYKGQDETVTQSAIDNKLKARKLNEEIRQGKEALLLEKVVIGADEYEKFLKAAYDAEPFLKPRDAAGKAKILPAPEMEKLMVTHIEVKEDDLRLLTSQRALHVRAALLVSGEVTPDRVFLIETKALLPPSKEKVKNSRVDFRLK